MLNSQQLKKCMDMTLLSSSATYNDLEKFAEQALKFKVGAICVNSFNVSRVKKIIGGHDVKICSVVGYPLGANLTDVKSYEAKLAISNGACEIDMVMNVGAFLSEDFRFVREDINKVVRECPGAIIKVIIEVGLLNHNQIRQAAIIVNEARAHFVKTMSGFAGTVTSPEQVKIIKNAVGEDLGIKASGGTRTYEAVYNFIMAGANRIGIRPQDVGNIIEEWEKKHG